MADRPSVQEILAAARKGGASPTPGSSKPGPASEKPPAPRESAAPEILESSGEGFSSVSAVESVEPAAPGGRPLTIREKLAAARSGGGAPPAAKPAAVAEPAQAPSGKSLSVKEKLAAARGGGGASPAVEKAKALAVGVPVVPSKPAARDPKGLAEALRKAADAREKAPKVEAKRAEPAPRPGRRGLLIGAALLAPIGGGLAWLIRKVLAEPPRMVKVGPPSAIPAGAVRGDPDWDFVVVRRSGRIFALKSACTHLGCATRWVGSDSLFRCPCHGSAFDAEGINVEGPAPRPLERYKVAVGGDGQVVVDRGRTFRKELGGWDDPASFVPEA